MSYITIYNSQVLIKTDKITSNKFRKNACFSSLFNSPSIPSYLIKVLIPLNVTNCSDYNTTKLNIEDAKEYLKVLNNLFGGISSKIITINPNNISWDMCDLKQFKSLPVKLKVLVVIIDFNKLKYTNRLFYKMVFTSLRYLYETPYNGILNHTIKLYKYLNNPNINLFNLLLYNHYFTKNHYIGEGHSLIKIFKLENTINPSILLNNNILEIIANTKLNYPNYITYSTHQIITTI